MLYEGKLMHGNADFLAPSILAQIFRLPHHNTIIRNLPDICFVAFHGIELLRDDVKPVEGFEWGIFACEYATDKSPVNKYNREKKRSNLV